MDIRFSDGCENKDKKNLNPIKIGIKMEIINVDGDDKYKILSKFRPIVIPSF